MEIAADDGERHELFIAVTRSLIQEIETAVPIKDGEAAFDLPAIRGITDLGGIVPVSWPPFSVPVFPMVDGGTDASGTQGSTKRLAVIAFVCPDAFRSAPSFANREAIHRLEGATHVMDVGFDGDGGQGKTVSIHENAAF